ncbi:carboxypeptidase-like regulatory domain-containing protein [Aestuariivivens sediminis]|uniref:carboxypeptidase-like regulatory domain-containing protein n=1 Tax=Aestuariivivens sediminis TaxID=2913557 RepID=UPI001F5A50F4|nr:carboxypeptidase-like regulatory domain-containing protein [Aestuariivivens sediminis]
MTAFSFSPNNLLSQNAKGKIDIDQSLTGEEIFKLIKEQTAYKFIYQDGLFDGFTKIEVKKGNINANQLSERSLSSGKFSVKFTANNTILVRNNDSLKVGQQAEVSGVISDESGMPLAGASVIEKGTKNGTQSDFICSFFLNMSRPNATLIISFI